MPLFSGQFFLKNEQNPKPLTLEQTIFNSIFGIDHVREIYEQQTCKVLTWTIDLPKDVDNSVELIKAFLNIKNYIDEKMKRSADNLSVAESDYELTLHFLGHNTLMTIDGDVDSYTHLLKPLIQRAIDEKTHPQLEIIFNDKMYAKWIQPHLGSTLADGENLIELLDVLYSNGYQTQKLT